MDRWKEHTSTFLQGRFADISVAEEVLCCNPVGGQLGRIQVALDGQITGADAVVTVHNELDELLGTLTITPALSAVTNEFEALIVEKAKAKHGQLLKVATDGGSTGAVPAAFTLAIVRS